MVDVEIRDARVPARVVALPFYRRPLASDGRRGRLRHRPRQEEVARDGPRRPALHQGSRVGPPRRRRGDRRHHGLRRRPARRHRLRRAARRSARRSRRRGTFGVVESVKAVSDLFAPVGGEVVATNDALGGSPELVNSDPYGEGWMIRVTVADAGPLDDLLDAAAYDDLIAAG